MKLENTLSKKNLINFLLSILFWIIVFFVESDYFKIIGVLSVIILLGLINWQMIKKGFKQEKNGVKREGTQDSDVKGEKLPDLN